MSNEDQVTVKRVSQPEMKQEPRQGCEPIYRHNLLYQTFNMERLQNQTKIIFKYLSQREVLWGPWSRVNENPWKWSEEIRCTWERPLLFAKREIRTEPCSQLGRSREALQIQPWVPVKLGRKLRILTRHHPRACWEFEPWKLRFGWLCSGSEPTS